MDTVITKQAHQDTDRKAAGKQIVYINIETNDTITYTKDEIKEILKACPELTEKFPEAPDACYAISVKNYGDFCCENCQDGYYALYAYLLKPKNGEKKYRQERKTLIDLYRDINSIYQRLAGGGTYFGHQYTRILGYAEYSIYLGKGNDYYTKNYNITGQKNLYINSLKQNIYDEVNNDEELSPKEKTDKQLELLKTITNVDRLITNYFYLKMAERFQYSHY